jgi:hypothetical protein
MGVAMRLIIIALTGVTLLAGFIPLGCPRPIDVIPDEPPDLKRPNEAVQFKVIVDLVKPRYRVGEEVSIKVYVMNMADQPITIVTGVPLHFVRVYDADNREVLSLPEWPPLAVAVYRALAPNVPYFDWRGGVYTFNLELPGRYKIVAWAEFQFDDPVLIHWPLAHIYAEPIWIEVVNGSN